MLSGMPGCLASLFGGQGKNGRVRRTWVTGVPMGSSTALSTPRLRTWKTIPPGAPRLERGTASTSPRPTNDLSLGGCDL